MCRGVDTLYKDTISRCTILNDLKIGCTICFEASITKTGNLARGKDFKKDIMSHKPKDVMFKK